MLEVPDLELDVWHGEGAQVVLLLILRLVLVFVIAVYGG